MRDIDVDPGAPDTWADQLLRALAEELTQPHPAECLQCYVSRMLDSFGCDTTLRFAVHYRDVNARAAVGLEGRLGRAGGFCDCEIFLNGWWLDRRIWSMARHPAGRSAARGATSPPSPLPPCGGVRRGSTKPCGNWERRSRSAW